MADIIIKDNNKDEVLKALDALAPKILEIIGLKAEKYAKALCPVGTVESTGIKGYRGGTLRNSITHLVNDKNLSIGSNVEYAPYVELGTGPHFTPPPDWENFTVPPSKGVGHGYIKPRPYLRPAIENHLNEYNDVIINELKNA